MAFPAQKRPLIVRPSTMVYGKFTFADMERLKHVYKTLRSNTRRIHQDFLKPYEFEGVCLLFIILLDINYKIMNATTEHFVARNKSHQIYDKFRVSLNKLYYFPHY